MDLLRKSCLTSTWAQPRKKASLILFFPSETKNLMRNRWSMKNSKEIKGKRRMAP